jgi:hypothetical protein
VHSIVPRKAARKAARDYPGKVQLNLAVSDRAVEQLGQLIEHEQKVIRETLGHEVKLSKAKMVEQLIDRWWREIPAESPPPA